MSEHALIKKIKKGDQHALDTFIREMYPSVYTFAYRKMQGDDLCKDITQEVFIRFIKSIPMYHEEGKSLHYLYRITSNVCKDFYKKSKHQYYDDIDEKAYLFADEEDVHETILIKLRDKELFVYIQSLSIQQQDIILLKYYHQLTFQEIADILLLPLSTVKSRHIAALKVLRKCYKESEENE